MPQSVPLLVLVLVLMPSIIQIIVSNIVPAVRFSSSFETFIRSAAASVASKLIEEVSQAARNIALDCMFILKLTLATLRLLRTAHISSLEIIKRFKNASTSLGDSGLSIALFVFQHRQKAEINFSDSIAAVLNAFVWALNELDRSGV